MNQELASELQYLLQFRARHDHQTAPRCRWRCSLLLLVLLEPEEVSKAAQRAKPNDFDLVLGHDAAAVAAARGKASAPFAHGGTWVPRAVWAAPPRRKAPKASLVCGAAPRPNYYRRHPTTFVAPGSRRWREHKRYLWP